MNALTETPAEPVQASQPDVNSVYTNYMAQAVGLPSGGVAEADALLADIVSSGLSSAVFKPLAAAMGKATGLDGADFLKQMNRARGAAEGGAASASAGGTGDDPEPHPSPEPLGKVLDTMLRVIRHQVVCDVNVAVAAALWAAGTWGFANAAVYPLFVITSPTPGCGKSTLLRTLACLVSKPVKADNMSTSVLFRLVAKNKPTLLIDEVDTFIKQNEIMRGVLNSGYERTGTVWRTEVSPDGKTFVPTEFPVFCPKVLSGIGGVPGTVLSRAIVAELKRAQRRGAGGRRSLRPRALATLRRDIVPHLSAHGPSIEAALEAGCAKLPPKLLDRPQDNWEPLLALADLAGGLWPAMALEAARALSGTGDPPSVRELLLADVKEIVVAKRKVVAGELRDWHRAGRTGPRPETPKHVRSAELVGELLKMEHRPWPDFGRDGRGLTTSKLARELKEFGLRSTDVRMPVRHPLASQTEVVKAYSIPELRTVYRSQF